MASKAISVAAVAAAMIASGFLGAAIHARCVTPPDVDVIVLKPPTDAPPRTPTAVPPSTAPVPTIDAMLEAAIDAPQDEPADAATCAHACPSSSQDCPGLDCACEDGTHVDTRNCFNGCCVGKPDACISSCKKHDGIAGSWNDDREGGRATGKHCGGDRDCASGLCARGYCSKKCDSFADCPPFWKCEAPPNKGPFDRFCQQE